MTRTPARHSHQWVIVTKRCEASQGRELRRRRESSAEEKTHGLKNEGGRRRPVLWARTPVTRRPHPASISSWFFFCRHRVRSWSPGLRTFSLRRCRSVYNSALARGEERLWDSSHALEPGDMHTTIRLHDGECLQQPRARSHGFYRSCCFIARSPKKGNEIQRCWRLYELLCCASNGSDLLIRHVSIISYS